MSGNKKDNRDNSNPSLLSKQLSLEPLFPSEHTYLERSLIPGNATLGTRKQKGRTRVVMFSHVPTNESIWTQNLLNLTKQKHGKVITVQGHSVTMDILYIIVTQEVRKRSMSIQYMIRIWDDLISYLVQSSKADRAITSISQLERQQIRALETVSSLQHVL